MKAEGGGGEDSVCGTVAASRERSQGGKEWRL